MTHTEPEKSEIASMTRRLGELGYDVVRKSRVKSLKADLTLSPIEFWRRGRYWRSDDPDTQKMIQAKLATAIAMHLVQDNAILIERHRAPPYTLSLTGHLKTIYPEVLGPLLEMQAEKVA